LPSFYAPLTLQAFRAFFFDIPAAIFFRTQIAFKGRFLPFAISNLQDKEEKGRRYKKGIAF